MQAKPLAEEKGLMSKIQNFFLSEEPENDYTENDAFNDGNQNLDSESISNAG